MTMTRDGQGRVGGINKSRDRFGKVSQMTRSPESSLQVSTLVLTFKFKAGLLAQERRLTSWSHGQAGCVLLETAAS